MKRRAFLQLFGVAAIAAVLPVPQKEAFRLDLDLDRLMKHAGIDWAAKASNPCVRVHFESKAGRLERVWSEYAANG